MTNIEWTDETWNPIVGCSIVSAGCTNCYAMKMAGRLEAMHVKHYDGTTKQVNHNTVWTGKIALAPEHILLKPLSWKKPRKIFVNSMGDLFHEDVPDAWIDKVFAVMALCPQHTFQILTKRSTRMREYFGTSYRDRVGAEMWEISKHRTDYVNGGCPLMNVWLGVSAEDQRSADERIPDLLATPAAVRFVSAEPLIGPINFNMVTEFGAGTSSVLRPRDRRYQNPSTYLPALDWIIVGGESGPNARPMHPDWARSIRDQCADAGTAFYFKQWGEWAPGENCDYTMTRTERVASWFADEWQFEYITPAGSAEQFCDDEADVYRCGKKRAGRLLDGVEHNQFPEVNCNG